MSWKEKKKIAPFKYSQVRILKIKINILKLSLKHFYWSIPITQEENITF